MSRKIRELAIPKYKKDWPGRTLLMKEACPIRHRRWGKDDQPSLLREWDLVTIERFLPKNEARYIGHLETSQWVEEGQRVIKLTWTCPTCAARHEDYIPESFIRQKKAIFVEVTGTEGEEA